MNPQPKIIRFVWSVGMTITPRIILQSHRQVTAHGLSKTAGAVNGETRATSTYHIMMEVLHPKKNLPAILLRMTSIMT